MDVATLVRAMGGFASTAALTSRRISDRHLTDAVRCGNLRRIRNGRYTTRDTFDPEVRAIGLGGRLTGISALKAMGAWVWTEPSVLHVALARGASPRRPAGPRERLHFKADDGRGGSLSLVDLPLALGRVVLDEPLEEVVPCLDWALSTGRLDRFGFEELLLRLPRDARTLRAWVDDRSQSVLESVARCRLQSAGWSVRSQARVGELGAIDLVVEDLIALELDGREHHLTAFESDRMKDVQIAIEGRHSLRVTSTMLRRHWPSVELAIQAGLAARRRGDAGNSAVAPSAPRGSRVRPRAART
ncbi:MAG: hypothetical protein ABI632_12290 [Pseudolysinimonas sp.]